MVVRRKPPESQFAFVVVAARRARQLMSGAPLLIERPRSHHPTRIAQEELLQGRLEYEIPPLPGEELDEGEEQR